MPLSQGIFATWRWQALRNMDNSGYLRGSTYPVYTPLSLITWAILFVCGVATGSTSPLLLALFLIFCSSALHAVRHWRSQYIYLLFLASIFIFLLARPTLELLGYAGGVQLYPWSETTENHVLLILNLGLLGLSIGVLMATRGESHHRQVARVQATPPARMAALQTSLLLLIPTGLARAASHWERATFVGEVGFYDLYTDFQSRLPLPVSLLADGFDFVVMLGLATRPGRLVSSALLGLYLVDGLASLAALQRSGFFLNFLVICVYLAWRALEKDEASARKVLKRLIYSLVGLAPIFAIVSNRVASLRRPQGEVEGGVVAQLLDFLYAQGVSINVIAFTEQFAGSIPPSRFFSFGPLIEFLKYRVFSIFSGETLPVGNDPSRAIEGHQLSHTISYIVMPDAYMAGGGYGSSFLAELYVDGALAAVLIGSVLLGIVLGWLPRALGSDIAITTLGLLVARELFFVPRGSFVGFLVNPFSLGNLLIAAVCFAVYTLVSTQHRPQQALSSQS